MTSRFSILKHHLHDNTPCSQTFHASLLCTKVQSLCPSMKHQGNLVLANCSSFSASLHASAKLNYFTMRFLNTHESFRSGYNSALAWSDYFSFLFSNDHANSISSTASLLINSVRSDCRDFPDGPVVKNSPSKGFPGGPGVGSPPANAGDTGSIPDQGRSHLLQGS